MRVLISSLPASYDVALGISNTHRQGARLLDPNKQLKAKRQKMSWLHS